MKKFAIGFVFAVAVALVLGAVNGSHGFERTQAYMQGYPVPGAVKAIVSGAASAKVELVSDSYYDVVATEDIYYRLGATGDAATDTDMILPANVIITIRSGTTNVFLHALQISVAGKVRAQLKGIAQ
jgi:hypothetical protein